MPFPTNPALEAAVIADAENDLPRLVYADWLDENGDPARAAFIRAQCALWDKNSADTDYQDWVELRREAFDRVKWRELEPRLPEGVGFHDTLYDPDRDDAGRSFHRGFPYFVQEPTSVTDEMTAADRFRAALPKLLAATTARGFQFYGNFSRQLHRIVSAPESGRFTALKADNTQTAPDQPNPLHILTGSPMADSLRWLEMSLTGDTDAGKMAATPFLHLHRWAAYHGFNCSTATLRGLVSADWFAHLHRLLCPFRGEHAETLWAALADAPDLHTVQVWGWNAGGGLAAVGTKLFRSLGRLQLHSFQPTDDDLAGLVRARFPKLAKFDLRGALRNDGLKQLLTADWFAGLRVLTLDCDPLGDQGVVALGRSPAAGNLRSLTLDTPRMSKKAFASLARDFPRLTTLDLSATLKKKMTPPDMAVFATAMNLPDLRHLNLDGWPIDDTGAAALAANPSLSHLTRLSFDYTDLGGSGIRALLTSPHLQRLVFLSVQCQSGGDGMELLADPKVLPHLTHCWLPKGVPPSVFQKLLKARGDIFIGGPR